MMAEKSLVPMMTSTRKSAHRSKRSALGIGVTTLITVLVVLLFTTFAILSYASARADAHLSRMVVQATTDRYAADSAAVAWYAELDAFLSKTTTSDWNATLRAAGYTMVGSSNEEVQIYKTFSMGSQRELAVTVAVALDGTPTIRQWQTVSTVSK